VPQNAVRVMAVEIQGENLAGRGVHSGQMSHLVRHRKKIVDITHVSWTLTILNILLHPGLIGELTVLLTMGRKGKKVRGEKAMGTCGEP